MHILAFPGDAAQDASIRESCDLYDRTDGRARLRRLGLSP